MIKSVKWFFVVLVIGSLISLGFSKESIPAEKLKLGDAAPQLMLCDSVQLLDLHDARLGKLRCGVQRKKCRIGASGR